MPKKYKKPTMTSFGREMNGMDRPELHLNDEEVING